VRRTWKIKQIHLASALDIAADLLTRAGYLPTKKERGIVEWEERLGDAKHACKIRIRSFVSTLNKGLFAYGYITVDSCDCERIQKFRDIAIEMDHEFRRRGWNYVEKLQNLPVIFWATR